MRPGERPGAHRCPGFTLVELVVVLTLLGIIAAVVGPRFVGTGAFDERAYYDEVASALSYAQKIAIASGCPVRAQVTPGSYTLGQQAPLGGHCDPSDAGFANPVRLPDGQLAAGTTPPGVTVGPALDATFDALGRTNLGSDQSLSIGSRTLQVQAESGLVLTP